jgi:hypothetical protein
MQYGAKQGVSARQRGVRNRTGGYRHGIRSQTFVKENRMSTPDHVENTGDNLRHAAEVQEQAQEDGTEAEVPPDDQQSAATHPPDFNT